LEVVWNIGGVSHTISILNDGGELELVVKEAHRSHSVRLRHEYAE
jgi:hypothetical protein